MKILLYCPLRPFEPRVEDRTLQSILALSWPGEIDIVFGKHDHKVTELDAAYDEITLKYETARRMALDGCYDALFTVEADMILPPLALERLTRVDADVAYGLYVSRRPPHQWLAYDLLKEKHGESIDEDKDYCREAFGQVVDTVGVGMGCTLIRWHVLRRVMFRRQHGFYANDWYFSLDLQRQGYRQAHDLGVVCGHINGKKTLWPDPQAENMVRIEN